jgi:hypothetical protein
VALVGWVFLFSTSTANVKAYAVGVVGVGLVGFFLWSWRTKRWPFQA